MRRRVLSWIDKADFRSVGYLVMFGLHRRLLSKYFVYVSVYKQVDNPVNAVEDSYSILERSINSVLFSTDAHEICRQCSKHNLPYKVSNIYIYIK